MCGPITQPIAMRDLEQDIHFKSGGAYTFFRKRFSNFPEQDAEDFKSFCIIAWLGGRSIHTSYRYLAVDFFRMHGAETSNSRPRRDAFQKAGRSQVIEKLDKRTIEASDGLFMSAQSFDDLISGLDLTTKMMVVMHFKYGHTMDELAHVYDLDLSRISQIIKAALASIKRTVA